MPIGTLGTAGSIHALRLRAENEGACCELIRKGIQVHSPNPGLQTASPPPTLLTTSWSHAVPPKVALQMNFPENLTVSEFPGGRGHALRGLPWPCEAEQNTEHPPARVTD